MPTIQEIADSFAERLKDAVSRDGFTKSAAVTTKSLTASSSSRILAVVTKEASEWDKEDEILAETARKLRYENTAEFVRLVKSGSNDAYLRLVTHITQILPTPKPQGK